MLNDVQYTIKIIADYDLSDGGGILEDNVLATYNINTLPRQVPTPELINMNILENSIDFGINIDDLIGIIDKDTLVANLYIEDEFVISSNVSELYFDVYISNLFANKSFRIELLADYDLNDGNGTHVNQVIYDEEFSTLENFLPSVVIEDMIDTQGYLTVIIDVNDINDTLLGSLWAVLYEEDVAVGTIYFDTGETELVFDYATVSGTNYYLEIYADYNLRDGSGAELNQSLSPAVLLSVEPKGPIAEIKSVVTTTTSISLEIDVIDADETIDPGSIRVYLYLGDSQVPVETIVFDPLNNTVLFDSVDILSDNEYTIVVGADYDLDDGSGLLLEQDIKSHEVSTDAKVLPEFEFELSDTTYDSITFDLDIVDVDEVLLPANTVQAVLMLNNAPAVGIDPIDLDQASNSLELFEDLYSNQKYTIDFVAVYDLNDGSYDETPVVLFSSGELKTESYQKPTASDVSLTTTINSIVLVVSIEDVDGVIDNNLEAVVYSGDTIITSKPLLVAMNQTVTLDGLDSETEYTVKIEADYDLNEASGPVLDGLLHKDNTETLPLSAPTATISTPTPTTESFTVDIFLNNSSGTITGERYARLYKDGVYDNQEVALIDGSNESVEFGDVTGLRSNNVYEVRVFASYDLNDEAGNQLNEFISSYEVTTKMKTVPSVLVSNIVISNSEITFEYVLVDEFNVLDSDEITAGLYLVDGGFQTSQVLQTNTVTFGLSGFLADQAFEIKLNGSYDLNDGLGLHVDEEIDVLEFTTGSNEVPEASISNVSINQLNVTADVLIDDVDDTIAGNLRAELYDDTFPVGLPIATISNLVIGVNNLEFGEILEYGRMYTVVIVADYDLLDGELLQSDMILDEFVVEVNSKKLPEAVISNVVIGQDSIVFDVDIYDDDAVIQAGSMNAVIYLNGTAVETISLATLISAGVTNIIPLNSDNLYEIKIETSYDREDGNLIQNNYVIVSQDVTTEAKEIPTAEISIDSSDFDTIQFDVDINDADSISTVREAYIYDEDGNQVGLAIDLPNANSNNINKVFASLNSSHTYTIIVKITYDMNDGSGVVTKEVASSIKSTATKNTPIGVTAADEITTDSVTITYTYNDTNSVATTYLRVYDGVVFVKEVQITTNGANLTEIITGLDSNTAYTIQLETSYDLNDLDGVQTEVLDSETLSTLAKSVPTINITNLVISHTQIQFDYELVDENGVLLDDDISAVLTVNGTDVTKALLTNTVTFGLSGFLANQDFEIAISGNYNLDNGVGDQLAQTIATLEFTTASYEAPSAIINDVTINQLNVTVDVTVTDNDSMAVGVIRAELYSDASDTVPIDTIYNLVVGENNLEFAQTLEYGRMYSVVIVTDYDLLDGELLQEDMMLREFVVEVNSKKLPQGVISNVVIGQDLITFDVDIYDDDLVIQGGTINAVIYLDGTLVETIPLAGLTSAGKFNAIPLNSDNIYEIKIETSYDNGDGNGIQPKYVIVNEEYTTLAKEVPTAEIFIDFSTADTIQFDVVIDDSDSVSTVREAYIYDEDGNQMGAAIPLTTTNTINQIPTVSLLSDSTYTIIVKITYDLKDGNGVVTEEVTTTDQTTATKTAPTGIINVVSSTTDSVEVNFDYADLDNIGTTYLRVYDGLTMVKEVLVATTGNDLIQVIDELDPYISYTVKLETSYDLSDLNGVQVRTLSEYNIDTLTIVVIEDILEDITSEYNTLSDIKFDDIDDILVDGTNIEVTLTQYDTDTFITYFITPEGVSTLDLNNLLSENTYLVEFRATYNSNGTPETNVIYSYTFETAPRVMPTVIIDPASSWISTTGPDTISMNVVIGTDAEDYVTDATWTAYIYMDGVQTEIDSVDLYVLNGSATPEGTSQLVVFTGVSLSAGSYTVVVKADIDVNIYDALDPLSGFQHTALAQRTLVDAGN